MQGHEFDPDPSVKTPHGAGQLRPRTTGTELPFLRLQAQRPRPEQPRAQATPGEPLEREACTLKLEQRSLGSPLEKASGSQKH